MSGLEEEHGKLIFSPTLTVSLLGMLLNLGGAVNKRTVIFINVNISFSCFYRNMIKTKMLDFINH